jgi:penicillin-binding protein 2
MFPGRVRFAAGRKPLLNRPLRGAYPPGSTFKPFMALAALSLGKRTPQQAINDPGFFVLTGGHRFNDDKKGGHGRVDMYRSIVVSCDTYYYQLASELEIDDLAGVLKQFGFGQKSGIDIEGELTGVLPNRDWKRQRFAGKQFREEHRKWYLGDNISVGIGQGYNAYTPLQLAHAISTVATNGVAYKPHLVQSIQNTTTGNVTSVATAPTHTIAMKPEHWETVKNALVGVNKEGTGARAFAGTAYVSAGKTGTAQVYSLRGDKYDAKHVGERFRDHALFIAYAPAGDEASLSGHLAAGTGHCRQCTSGAQAGRHVWPCQTYLAACKAAGTTQSA